MRITIQIDGNNDAFVDRTKEELQDILSSITGDLWATVGDLTHGQSLSLEDSNGEYVGFVKLEGRCPACQHPFDPDYE